MAVFPFYVAIGGVGGQPLARHSLVAENRPYLLRGVLGIPLIDDISERGEVVAHLVVAVHSVVDGDKTDSHLWKADLRIQPYLQIIAAKPGHILNDYRADKPRLNVGQHFLKARALEAGAGIAVIFIHFIIGYSVVFGIFGEDLDLMGDAVAVPVVLIIAGEPDIEGSPLFALIIVLPVHHNLRSGSHRFFPCDIYIISNVKHNIKFRRLFLAFETVTSPKSEYPQ